MSTNVSSSIDLRSIMCSDPTEGPVYQLLFNGGSWFEAEQMFWRLSHSRLREELTTLTRGKATKGNAERAKMLLASLKEATKQLVASREHLTAYNQAEAFVTKWSARSRPASKGKGFAALAEESEEE